MHKILSRLPINMVYEAGKSSIAPALLIGHCCHSEMRLASKINGIERYSYEV